LYLARTHLTGLCALFDIGNQFLLLLLQLHAFPVEFTLRLFQRSLVLAQTLLRRHALAKSPFDDLERETLAQEAKRAA
jgi:hypothetical protein